MSETPQQHGWQPSDLTDPADDSARQQRGFGVFEAPSVPDDFPAFTPYSSLSPGTSSSPRADDFPPDSEQPSAFPGFPSEESSSYVPAPAVVPIPGVSHEAFPSEPAPPPSMPEYQDPSVSGSSSGSWAAFAAGDTPKPATSSSPKPWEELSPFEASLEAAASSYESPAPSYEPSSSSYESSSYDSSSYDSSSSSYDSYSSYDTSSYDSPSYEASSYEAPSYEAPSYETPSYEAPSYESSYEPPYQSSSFESPSFETPSYESNFKSPFRSPFEPSYESSEATPEPEPEPMNPSQPSAPDPGQAPPASGSVRVAASVPPGSRVEPLDPSEVAPPMPKPAGRVYGSASVGGGAIVGGSAPVSPGQGAVYTSSAGVYGQPADPTSMPGSPGMPVSPAAAGSSGMPGSPGVPAQAGMPGSPGVPVSPAPLPMPTAGDPATGMVRATARVTGVAQPNPGESLPVSKSSTVYGSSMAAAAPPAEAPAQGRPGRQPAFGDLLEPAAAPPSIPMQRGPQSPPVPPGVPVPPGMPGMPPQGHGQPGMPMPAGQQPGQLSAMMQPVPSGPPGQVGQPGQQPPARPMPAAAPEAPKPERKGRLIVGVLVGCVLLLAVAFGGLLLIDKLVSPPFVVGDCVKQSSNKQEAIAAACTDQGAYKVVSSVGSADECDKEQPYVKIDDEILCLKPAAS